MRLDVYSYYQRLTCKKAHEEVGIIVLHLTSPTCALAQVAPVEIVCPLVIINSFGYVHVRAERCTAAQFSCSTVEILLPS